MQIPSLEIKGYRNFKNLYLPSLGHINLIVGRNNIGKSSLLEALWIYAKRASLSTLNQILEQREEYVRRRVIMSDRDRVEENEDRNQWQTALESLFYGRGKISESDFKEANFSIKAGNSSKSPTLRVSLSLSESITSGQNSLFNIDNIENEIRPYLRVYFQNEVIFEQSVQNRRPSNLPLISPQLALYVPTGSFSSSEMQKLWNSVALQSSEDIVLESLRILSPDVQRLNYLVGTDLMRGYPIIKLKNSNTPVPLKSLGEGMTRLLGVVLALVNAKEGLLLIDEIDTGLHYSVQDDIWRLIFETAQKLNVQVFATTHSKDTINSFQRVANQHDSEGMLLSLRARQKDGMIVAVPYSEDELAIATESDIEVR